MFDSIFLHPATSHGGPDDLTSGKEKIEAPAGSDIPASIADPHRSADAETGGTGAHVAAVPPLPIVRAAPSGTDDAGALADPIGAPAPHLLPTSSPAVDQAGGDGPPPPSSPADEFRPETLWLNKPAHENAAA